MIKYVIIGGGAQAKYAVDILTNCYNREIAGILDIENNKNYHGTMVGNVKVLGYYKDLIDNYHPEEFGLVLCHSNNTIKEKIYNQLKNKGYVFPNVIHPLAYVSKNVTLGEGNIIASHVSIMPFVKIGNCVVIHANSVIEHDCEISDFVNIAPSVTLAGYVKINKRAYIYTGAKILPNIKIGRDAKIGAGAVVVRDVLDNSTVKGIPAK